VLSTLLGFDLFSLFFTKSALSKLVEDIPCHRCMSKQIFRGAKDFFPKSCRVTFADRFCGVTCKKWSSLVFLQILGAIFRSQTTLGAISSQIFRDFA